MFGLLGNLSSPRTWGCFSMIFEAVLPGVVFPTHVGVFLMVLNNF